MRERGPLWRSGRVWWRDRRMTADWHGIAEPKEGVDIMVRVRSKGRTLGSGGHINEGLQLWADSYLASADVIFYVIIYWSVTKTYVILQVLLLVLMRIPFYVGYWSSLTSQRNPAGVAVHCFKISGWRVVSDSVYNSDYVMVFCIPEKIHTNTHSLNVVSMRQYVEKNEFQYLAKWMDYEMEQYIRCKSMFEPRQYFLF